MITRADSEVLRLARALVRAEDAKSTYLRSLPAWTSFDAAIARRNRCKDLNRDIFIATERLISAAMAAYSEQEK